MNIFGKFISNFKEAYNEINAATLTGAIDAVVVRQKDGSYLSSPFHVRFGKIGVLRSREKVVDIEINGEAVDIHMKLGETGEAFFVEELEEGVEVSPFLGTSPLPHYLDDYAGEPAPDEDDARSQDSGVEAEELIHRRSKEEGDILAKGPSGGRRSNRGNPEGTTKERAPLERRQTVVANFSPCMNVPGMGSPGSSHWREELVRSKSLSSEFPLRRASGGGFIDAFGSKTDVEDSAKSARRRRKKRTNNKKQRSRATESQSSDNSTTSETVDISSFSVSAPAPDEPMFIMDDVENAHEINRAALKRSADWPGNVSSSLALDFHPFSDTDISPPPSPAASRSGTPVKSDTEYECRKQKNDLGHSSGGSRDGKWSWTWGELPTPPVTPRPSVTVRPEIHGTDEGDQDREKMAQVEDAHRSMLGGMFSFMRATRKARHNPVADGIYLDDLKLEELDPEVAALYFPRNSLLLEKQRYSGFQSMAKDEDGESGNGTSLPQSPHSVEGAIGGSKLLPLDSDFEEAASRHPFFDYRGYHDLSFSLCGALHEYLEGQFPEALFLQSLVTYDDFCENPDLIHSPNLVVRLGGSYMNWATAAPQIMALVLFQRPLPSKVVESVEKANMPKKEIRKRTESRGYSWFTWGRYQEQQQQQTTQQESTPSQEDLGTTTGDGGGALPSNSPAGNQEPRPATLTSEATPLTSSSPPSATTASPTAEVSAFPENPAGAKGSRKRNESSESEDPDEDISRRRYRKTIRLSSERIKKLNLRNGSNEVVFSVTTAYQGTTRCRCHIFLWNYDEKIVISDIDGTITKSDVLGHILPIIGKDWAQGGVAQLFTKIKNNGYNFLYLSARAIGQARTTRDYLRSIRQGDVSLPDGPLLLNPTSLIQAFHREVIEKKPEEFKISCLKDIRALFPPNENPFYAGYGNKINDVWAYSAVGIPIQRIFTINHRGELKHELTQTFQSTYSNLSDIAHHMFPPEQERKLHDEFSSLLFWRHPLPDYSSEIDAALSQQAVK